MPKPRGREHTTLTQTATIVVRELKKCPGIKMIAPGEITTSGRRTTGKRHLTMTLTSAGLQLLITGQSVQKVAVHCDAPHEVIRILTTAKSLRDFAVLLRERNP